MRLYIAIFDADDNGTTDRQKGNASRDARR